MKLSLQHLWILTTLIMFSIDFFTGVILMMATIVILLQEYEINKLKRDASLGSDDEVKE